MRVADSAPEARELARWAFGLVAGGWALLGLAYVGLGGAPTGFWLLSNPIGLVLGAMALRRRKHLDQSVRQHSRNLDVLAWLAVIFGATGLLLTLLLVVAIILFIQDGNFE